MRWKIQEKHHADFLNWSDTRSFLCLLLIPSVCVPFPFVRWFLHESISGNTSRCSMANEIPISCDITKSNNMKITHKIGIERKTKRPEPLILMVCALVSLVRVKDFLYFLTPFVLFYLFNVSNVSSRFYFENIHEFTKFVTLNG